MSRSETMKLVAELKAAGEDAEFYPTTDEIIRKVARDIDKTQDNNRHERLKSVLDIGAGDGRVLKAIQKFLKSRELHVDCYAIEKAIHHLSNMPKDITVIGTDFEQQTLVDKPVSVIFCNPPYSEFEQWVMRIVREASTAYVYLVIPRRWRDSIEIKRAIEARLGEVTSLGEFDFENADRKAQAKVEVVRIEFGYEKRDAFRSVIEDMLPELDVFDVELEPDVVDLHQDMISGSKNLVEALTDAYDAELVKMVENYRAAMRIDAHVLKELGVTKDRVLDGIKLKIKGLKNKYWKALFNEIDTITQRLATKQRNSFLESLKDKVSIDFTANNVYSILIWVSKWANDFFDEQLIELFMALSTDSCVVKYKSNDRVWTKAGWRYLRGEETDPTHYKLEYRIVLSRGGICTSDYGFERDQHRGLQSSSFEILKDIVTVANNLGFPCKDSPKNYQWESNKQNTLILSNGKPLVAVRAFKNGNMHLHFDPKVMLAINVEAGRLLKWIRNPAEACSEMGLQGDDAKQVAEMFGSSFRITPDSGFLRLTAG
mgnify:CR=1 FL=1